MLVSLIDDDVDFRRQKRNGKKNVGLVFFWFIDDVANLAPRKWPFCVASDLLVSLIDDDVDFRHQKRKRKKNVGLVFSA